MHHVLSFSLYHPSNVYHFLCFPLLLLFLFFALLISFPSLCNPFYCVLIIILLFPLFSFPLSSCYIPLASSLFVNSFSFSPSSPRLCFIFLYLKKLCPYCFVGFSLLLPMLLFTNLFCVSTFIASNYLL